MVTQNSVLMLTLHRSPANFQNDHTPFSLVRGYLNMMDRSHYYGPSRSRAEKIRTFFFRVMAAHGRLLLPAESKGEHENMRWVLANARWQQQQKPPQQQQQRANYLKQPTTASAPSCACCRRRRAGDGR